MIQINYQALQKVPEKFTVLSRGFRSFQNTFKEEGEGFREVPGVLMGLQGDLQESCFSRFQEVSDNFRGLQWAPWEFEVHHGI